MSKKIKIPDDLYEQLKKCAAAAGYSGTEEFVIHVLEKSAQPAAISDDEEKIKERLKGLGYLG